MTNEFYIVDGHIGWYGQSSPSGTTLAHPTYEEAAAYLGWPGAGDFPYWVNGWPSP